MNVYNIRFLPDNIITRAREGDTIARAAIQAGIPIALPCGGRGVCGRCVALAGGRPVRICRTPVTGDMTIHIPEATRLGGQSVMADIRLYNDWRDNIDKSGQTEPLPRVRRVSVSVTPSSSDDPPDDSPDDFSRLRVAVCDSLGMNRYKTRIALSCLRELPRAIRERGGRLEATVLPDAPCGADAPHWAGAFHWVDAGGGADAGGGIIVSLSGAPLYGLAIDIGTTTIAAALCDLETGLVIDTVGAPNPQARYGLDIISRIVFSEERHDGLELLREAVTGALSEAVNELTGRNGIDPGGIPLAVIAGNTVMSHMLLGLPCDHLRREPYTPATREYPEVSPALIGLPIMPEGKVLIIPSVASYIGGDIVAGVIATDLAGKKGIRVLIDIGTNGEIVLAGEGFMAACSCSAGPAFEGSGVSCGSRAVPSAISVVNVQDGRLSYETIGGPGVRPASVCGSGLISLLSSLYRIGAIDRAGRFSGGIGKFALTLDVSIDQADIMNLIRSKAAIYAGARVLTDHFDISISEIDKVYIAGGFGRDINIADAIDIGMLPPLPEESFSFVGNSSLAGALIVLNDSRVDVREVARAITNIELSADRGFMDEFMKACFIPHTDLSAWNKRR